MEKQVTEIVIPVTQDMLLTSFETYLEESDYFILYERAMEVFLDKNPTFIEEFIEKNPSLFTDQIELALKDYFKEGLFKEQMGDKIESLVFALIRSDRELNTKVINMIVGACNESN